MQWSKETVRAAADRLVEQKAEAGNFGPPSVTEFRSDRPEWLPSDNTVAHYYDNFDNLKREMGFLTPRVIDGWTDQEWEENGQWFVDSCRELGLPINRQTCARFSMAKLAPSEPRILERYRNFTGYYRALGLENDLDTGLDYSGWDFDTHVENGKWFSELLGADTGMPIMPTEELSAAGSELALVPKITRTGKVFKSWERYQHYLGFVTRYTTDTVWDDAAWIENGQWLADVFMADSQQPWLNEGVIRRAGTMHIGPRYAWIMEKFEGVIAYNQALGFHSSETHKHLSDREVLEQLEKKTQNNNGLFPTHTKYVEQRSPDEFSTKLVERRFGSFGQAAEALGYIISTRHWGEPEYLKNGLLLAISNNGVINQTFTRKASPRQQSPSSRAIDTFFDGKYPEYKAKVEELYEQFRIREKNGLPARFAFGVVALTLTQEPSDEFAEVCEAFENNLDRIANDPNFKPLLPQIRNMDTVNMSTWDLVDFAEYITFLKRRGIDKHYLFGDGQQTLRDSGLFPARVLELPIEVDSFEAIEQTIKLKAAA